VTLAVHQQAAVYAAPMSARCGFPERHPLFAGFLPAWREKIVTQLAAHDFILVVGAPAFSYHVEGNGPHVPAGATLWQIVDDAQVAAWTPSGNSIVASTDLALDALIAASQPATQRAEPQARAAPPRVEASMPMSAAFAMQTLDQARGAHDVVVEEAPGARGTMQQYLPMDGAERFYTMASGGLGWGMPAAVGVALARQKQGLPGRVIALLGDGSSMYSIQALYSASQLRVPITFVVLNNRRYAALQEFAPVFGYSQEEKPAGTDLPDLDFVALARGQGCDGVRVEHPTKLADVLRRGAQHDGPLLIEIAIQ